MPIEKDLKRLVRRRMEKTGESYTAARAQLLQSSPASTHPGDLARRAGMTDDAVRAATGRDWESWSKALDRAGAHEWPHREIAKHVQERFALSAWWSQSVTVGYERIRGLREIGQRRGGAYEATKARTFAAPVGAVFDAFAKPRTRARWLGDTGHRLRSQSPRRSLRFSWSDGSSVEIRLAAKGRGKTSVQVTHGDLPSKESVASAKQLWHQRLDALAGLLGPRSERKRRGDRAPTS